MSKLRAFSNYEACILQQPKSNFGSLLQQQFTTSITRTFSTLVTVMENQGKPPHNLTYRITLTGQDPNAPKSPPLAPPLSHYAPDGINPLDVNRMDLDQSLPRHGALNRMKLHHASTHAQHMSFHEPEDVASVAFSEILSTGQLNNGKVPDMLEILRGRRARDLARFERSNRYLAKLLHQQASRELQSLEAHFNELEKAEGEVAAALEAVTKEASGALDSQDAVPTITSPQKDYAIDKAKGELAEYVAAKSELAGRLEVARGMMKEADEMAMLGAMLKDMIGKCGAVVGKAWEQEGEKGDAQGLN